MITPLIITGVFIMEQHLISKDNFTYDQAKFLQKENVWQTLSNISMMQAMESFLDTLSPHTKRQYMASFNSFFSLGILNPKDTLQAFILYNLETALDSIKARITGSEATKQARCAAFISFTGFLARRTQGMIRKAIASKDNGASTFKKIRSKATTEALTEKELNIFLKELQSISYRDYLIAKTILQGAKRLDEVLTAKITQIDWTNNKITFKQSKSRELEQITIIHYPEYFMKELKEYVADRKKEDLIFITSRGKKVVQPHIFRSFVRAGIKSNLSKKVSAHSLRATAITILTNKGYSTEQIMKVSGHVTSGCVAYYDKTPIEKNITQEVALI